MSALALIITTGKIMFNNGETYGCYNAYSGMPVRVPL
jgi:hypothetical protein